LFLIRRVKISYLEYFQSVKKISRDYQPKSGNYETLSRLSALPLRLVIGGGAPVGVSGWAAPNPFSIAEDIDKWLLPMTQNHHITFFVNEKCFHVLTGEVFLM
jgi:hypothetical protein